MLFRSLKFDLIFSSPYIRAKHTADIVGGVLNKEVTVTDLLLPGFNPADLIAEINDEKPQRVLLVGHEPDLSEFISLLISGNSNVMVELKKGALCKLTTNRLAFGRCATLNWLLAPKQLTSMRKI